MSGGDNCHFECFLPVPREMAFGLVVDQLDRWWTSPFSRNPATPDPVREVAIEPYPGGVCYEIGMDGSRRIWGTILSIEKPLYIRIAWQVAPNCDRIADPGAASRVVIQFREAGEVTRLEVTHGEFIRHGPAGDQFRDFMASEHGWPLMLANLSHTARECVRA
ncbi:SRPBCC domain-containing protein [Roseibium sediminis]|uniref:SRPBCC domain-containing protein n=1 Tax=Roseibium sediminis TaxID=1775174 RepID=UPI00123CF981|nr:SRPBCC domain-containing protein [Roseibium sediminis]